MKTAKKKRGRPPKDKSGPFGGRLSRTRTFRVRGGLDEALARSAEKAGRSLSEEIEARLERSFYLDGVLSTMQGEGARLFSALATAITVTHKLPTDALKPVIGIIIDAFNGPQERVWSWEAMCAALKVDPRGTSETEGAAIVMAGLVLANFGYSVPHFPCGRSVTDVFQVGEEK